MNPYTELISRYINNELSAAEKTAFEADLQTNLQLKKEYDLQLQVIQGVKRLGLKQEIKSSFKKNKTQKSLKKAVVTLAVTLAVIGAVLLVKKIANTSPNHILHELNEQGTTNWSEADKTLEAQVFTINAERDTIIETQHGTVISIHAHSFLNKQGIAAKSPIDVEIKEAMTPTEIMKAGLSTTSNGRLLETGGMFYINARNGEDNLTIDKRKPLNVNVPVNNAKNDMMLFKGERKADGTINWIEPKAMRKKLSTVDILKLDFYPEHFLDSVKAFGFNYKNKTLTDSIYYSYSRDCKTEGAIYTEDGFDMLSDTIKHSPDFETIKDTSLNKSKALTGENIFKMNCAVCHSMGTEKLTGPGLKNILEREPSVNWLKNYILNNNKVIQSGDVYANKLVAENGGADGMPEYEYLNDAQINSLIGYITGKKPFEIDANSQTCYEINPAKIKAIWDKKFNHTILATKEFEERLKVIFTTCDARVLNLYIKNLTHPLYEIDSIAATLLSGELKTKFLNFYNRKDGGVDITDEQSKKLQAYFEEKKTIYTNAVNKALQKMYANEATQAQLAMDERTKHFNAESIRQSKTFGEELEINMDEAYRQLGKKRPKALPADNYISGPILQTGWNNVDKYVIESTISRTTLNYTDPETSKKAIIKYEPITITINDVKKYDKVVCYMIPDKLSSFQLLKNTNSVFKENLNELMNYTIITIGFKGNSTYYHEIKSAKAQSYAVDLSSISAKVLDEKLNINFPLNQQQDLSKDINYQLFEMKENSRLLKIQHREEIRYRLESIVFPCAIKQMPASQLLEK